MSAPTTSSLPPLRRRPLPTPTNSLILLLPSPHFFQNPLRDLFKLHFSTYGTMLSWSPLENLGRVLVHYSEEGEAKEAKEEMDGFVWEEGEDEGGVGGALEAEESEDTTREGRIEELSLPKSTLPAIRVYYGPTISIPLPSSASSHTTIDYLSIPSLAKNFLISPPGSPPVGWEQILEDAPNKVPHSDDWEEDDVRDAEEGEGALGGGGMDELKRALRFLSVESGGDDTTAEQVEDAATGSTTIVPSSALKPTVIVSTPPNPISDLTSPDSPTHSPKQKKGRITDVKATVESMLGGKPFDAQEMGEGEDFASSLGSGSTRFVPTARPPPLPST